MELSQKQEIERILNELLDIRAQVLQAEKQGENKILECHPNHQYGARNLIRYLRLRTFDLRPLQGSLSGWGLSSLSHVERHVLANIENLLYLLHSFLGKSFEGAYPFGQHPVNYLESARRLSVNAHHLFKQNDNSMSIMVTLDGHNFSLEHIKLLLQNGMTIARINCSHDTSDIWLQMVENVKIGCKETKRPCAIYVDLAGPKLRIAEIFAPKKKRNNYTVLSGDKVLLTPFSEIAISLAEKRICLVCPVLEIISDTKVGESVWFDDGKIEAVIEKKEEKWLELRIKQTQHGGSKLKKEKGINLPLSHLTTPSLTDDDIRNLEIMLPEANIVGYSFVRHAHDVSVLQSHLARLGYPDIGIVLKIENQEAFENLPSILLQGMKSPTVGIMTARGDLAVELGVERLAEVQEEIMWLCEAALIPNIWATQVLENLAKKGQASRAEITDAAMSVRAECVMLNKGLYIVDALKTLNNILCRMEHHIHKKQGTMRPLHVAKLFFDK